MKQRLTRTRLITEIAAAVTLLLLASVACSLIGSESVSLPTVMQGQFLPNGQPNIDYEIFVHVRLPRILLACLVGAALACSGVVFQAVLRNPLADPYILGISSGAGLGTIVAVLFGFSWSFANVSSITLFSFAGAFGAMWIVWLIGRACGASRGNTLGLLLAGVVVNAFLSAMILFLTTVAKSHQLQTTVFWLMGNMNENLDYPTLLLSAAAILSGLVVLFMFSPKMNLLAFGTDDAMAMGINIKQVYLILFGAAALITSISVSFSGLIGFVGLIVPHTVRMVFGPDHRRLIPLSALIGAGFLVIADTIARVIVAPSILPVGVITAILGGPFFLVLMIRSNRK